MRFIFYPKGVEFQHAPLRNKIAFKPEWFTGLHNGVICFEPFLRFVRKCLPDGLPNDAAYSGLRLERRVGHYIAKVQRPTRSVSDLLDDAEAFVDALEQRAVLFLGGAQVIFGLF